MIKKAMSILHLCNTFFEWELSDSIGKNLSLAFHKSPIFLQLQFIPRLYVKEQDGIALSEDLDQSFSYQKLETWGYSLLAKSWAEKKGLSYPMPPWDIVKMVNSKTYSFSKSPLPGSRLVFRGDSLRNNTVLKTCYGTAGRGLIFTKDAKALNICEQEWAKNLPLIEEPWVKRKLDFSTQWIITPGKEIAYLGVTICKTDKKGVHQSNIAGAPMPKQVDEQKDFAIPILQEMADLGYFGEVGIDAMIYDDDKLQPVVEINARKTMGWLTLEMHKKQKHPIELSYLPSSQSGPLPKEYAGAHFNRQILIT